MNGEEHVDLVRLMSAVVLPVLTDMLTDREQVEDLRLCWEGKPPRRGRSDLMVTVTIEGEEFRWFLVIRGSRAESIDEARARFASDLQDFIAESRFGWGELRTYAGGC